MYYEWDVPVNYNLFFSDSQSFILKGCILKLLTFCLLLLPLWESVIVLCFVVRYFMSILVLQSSWWGRESWLLCLICLTGVLWWLSGSSSRCHGVVCSLWLWYFLIILTYYFSRSYFRIIFFPTGFHRCKQYKSWWDGPISNVVTRVFIFCKFSFYEPLVLNLLKSNVCLK